MTVTVTVKARAHGAKLTVNGEQHDLVPHQELKFHTDDQTALNIEVTEPAEAPVIEEPTSDLGDGPAGTAELASTTVEKSGVTEGIEEGPASAFGKTKKGRGFPGDDED